MRHHNHNRKFGRVKKVREALMRSLAVSLIRDGRIKTTEAKAKELRPFVEKMVTRAKNNSLATTRLLTSRLGGVTGAVETLTQTIAPAQKERKGGYTRIVKLPNRKSDASKMALIEFVK
ncbi:50S ribosomal protein L17 [bacterium]|nr:50S ribosomal protein L17 [bacterium]